MRYLVFFLALVPLCAQAPDGKKGGPRPPQNLKVLKQPVNIRQVMGEFRGALGVECAHCHIQGQFASDENPKKEIARKMIVMTEEINAKFPAGKVHVTCFTCHRGDVEPKTIGPMPPQAPPGPPKPPAEPKP